MGNGQTEKIVVEMEYRGEKLQRGMTKSIKTIEKLKNGIIKETSIRKDSNGQSIKDIRITKDLTIVKKQLANAQKNLVLAQRNAIKAAQGLVAARKQELNNAVSMMPITKSMYENGKLMNKSTTEFTKGLKSHERVIKDTSTNIKDLGNRYNQITTTFRNANGQIIKTTKSIERQRQEFPMWALSFLFAGMVIQRTSLNITKSTTKMFLDIDRGNTEQSRALIGLSAQWDYMRFSVGRALAEGLLPLLPAIQWLIKWFTDLAKNNPHKTFALIMTALGVGTTMTLVGQIVMLSAGIKYLTGLGLAAWGFKVAGVLWTLALPILAITAAIVEVVLIIKFWKQIVEAFRLRWVQFISSLKQSWIAIKIVFEHMKNGFMQLATSIYEIMTPVINWIGEKFTSVLNIILSGVRVALKLAHKLGKYTDISVTSIKDMTYTPIAAGTFTAAGMAYQTESDKRIAQLMLNLSHEKDVYKKAELDLEKNLDDTRGYGTNNNQQITNISQQNNYILPSDTTPITTADKIADDLGISPEAMGRLT